MYIIIICYFYVHLPYRKAIINGKTKLLVIKYRKLLHTLFLSYINLENEIKFK